MNTKCAAPGCKNDSYALGYCDNHYRRLRRAAERTWGGKPLERPKAEPSVMLGVRVPKSIAAKLKATGRPMTTAARGVLLDWAKTH